MKLKVIVIVLVLSVFACEKQPKPNLIVKGKIEGFRKGDLFLQQIQDSTLVNVDSVQFVGDQDFELKTFIEEPQPMLLQLKRFGSDEDAAYLDIFAEPGEFEFHFKKDSFAYTNATKSPENHQKYEAFVAVLKRFQDQNLELITQQLQTPKEDEEALQQIQKKFASLTRNKYLYTINFAIKNGDAEVAPYLVLSEAYDINTQFLDTVYKSLSPKIKTSKYGLQLKEVLDERAKEKDEVKDEVKETAKDDAS